MPSIRQIINRLSALGVVRHADRPFGWYVSKLRNGEPFSFSRFGDGEWNAILGREGENCDGHAYFPELGRRLREALCSPGPYFYALQASALKADGRAIAGFIRKNNVRISWHGANVFHYASRDARLFPLIEQLRRREVVVIGPRRLRALNRSVFPYRHFIEIPDRNCFLQADAAVEEIGACARARGPGLICAFSASMATNVMIHELYPRLGAHSWMIDFGSLWEVYVGAEARSKHIRHDWEKIIRTNLGGPPC